MLTQSEQIKVNPQMIILGRESRGLTQKELSDLLSITQGTLSKIESGLLQLSDQELRDISNILVYPVHFFIQFDPVYGPGISELYHRKRQSIPIREIKKIHAITHLRHMQIERLLKSVDIGSIDIKTIDLDEPGAPTPEEVARMTRAMLHLPTGPIMNVVSVIENAGGIIIPCDIETKKIDAMSRWIPGNPPLFFINKNMPMDRVRFTLSHELGHIIMHQIPNSNMEKQADAFAAEFLLPAEETRNSLDNLSLDKLSALKQYWKVSMAFIIYRAKELNKISENQARYLYAQMARLGYRTKEPEWLEPPREQPKLFFELIDVHLKDLGYSEEELSDLLLIDKSEFFDIFKQDSKRLRLIK
jgi:Zn-dependent peptidase ImmA (M78 family)/DNA-binding XRE family transcriptional regulator